MEIGTIIGIVAGVVVAVTVIAVVVTICLRRKRRASHSNESTSGKLSHVSTHQHSNGRPNGSAGRNSQSQGSSSAPEHVVNVPQGADVFAEVPGVDPPPVRTWQVRRPESSITAVDRIYQRPEIETVAQKQQSANVESAKGPNLASFPVPRATTRSPPPAPRGMDELPASPPPRLEDGGNPYAVSGVSRIEFDGGYINRAASLNSSLDELETRKAKEAEKPKKTRAPSPATSPLGSQLIADSNAFVLGQSGEQLSPRSDEPVYANRAFVHELMSPQLSPQLSPVEPVYINFSPPGSVTEVNESRRFAADTLTAMQLTKKRDDSNEAARSGSAHTLHDSDNRFSLPPGKNGSRQASVLRKSNRSLASSSSAGSIRKKVTWARGVKAPDASADAARERYDKSMPKTVSMAESCV